MIQLDHWCQIALEALLSLWDPDQPHAWRNSHEKEQHNTKFTPTTTFNVLLTFEEYGLFSSVPYLSKSPPFKMNLDGFLEKLLNPTEILAQSEQNSGKRQCIVLSQYATTLRMLVLRASPSMVDEKKQHIERALDELTQKLIKAFPQTTGAPPHIADDLAREAHFSPSLLLHAQGFLTERKRILGQINSRAPNNEIAESIEKALNHYFDREVDRLMARRGIAADPGFDAASLAFALKGLLPCRPRSFRQSPFFAACIQAIIDQQNADGTWPDGVTALVEGATVDTLQQPSVTIALTLAQIVMEPRMLVDLAPTELAVLENAVSALERTATYLTSTFVETRHANEGLQAKGWVSDRVRLRNTAETWITAHAAHFFLVYAQAVRAAKRARILGRFTTKRPKSAGKSVAERRKIWSDVGDPDAIIQPCDTIQREIVNPILLQQERQQMLVKPARDGVSFAIFGPPGSGKTYFVKQMAECLGWPLVELNPSNFVSAGAELIESKATEIFRDLMELDHAIVFFDECDELFLDRQEQRQGSRSILSFVTASMLPKLQELHDQRSVVFIVATNYLSRIDKAIRRPGRFDLLLLFDRPDADARRRLLEKNWSGSQLEEAIKATECLMTKEVLDFLEPASRNPASPPNGSQEDYKDWCRTDALAEITASRIDDAKKKLLIERWKPYGLREGKPEEPPHSPKVRSTPPKKSKPN